MPGRTGVGGGMIHPAEEIRGWPPTCRRTRRDRAVKNLTTICLTGLLASTAAAAGPEPFPGAVSRWEGFARHDFRVDGRDVIVVEPEKPLPGRPWAWRGEF